MTIQPFLPNVDVRPGKLVSFTADFDKPLPIMSDEWEGLYCKYALEHISWRKVRGFVSEVYRIMKKDGVAVFITANAEAQMKWALKQPVWDEKVSQCLGGDQDYSDNTHKVFLNPDFACQIFRDAGFSCAIVVKYGEFGTDMIIQATK